MNNMKKYELTENTTMHFGKKLFQIKALISFGEVEAGELGGWIEEEKNLDQSGNAWVSGNARVSGDARVSGNARVSGDARVYGDADYTAIKGFGTKFRTTTFFKCEDRNVRVVSGCFLGTIEEFRKQVKETRAGKIAKEYLLIADLMEEHFKEE